MAHGREVGLGEDHVREVVSALRVEEAPGLQDVHAHFRHAHVDFFEEIDVVLDLGENAQDLVVCDEAALAAFIYQRV